ncbi:MAG TPA: hypothetical protein VJ165_05295 [candidate division Zixibacteria bacterium]|nr:hypothetical protein [candidate division Zixibacteria bacterium]
MSFYRNRIDLIIGYVFAIIKHASEATNSIEENNKLDAERWWGIFTEHVFFFLHLTYRRIYPLFEEKEREILMTEIADIAIRMVIDSKGFFLEEETKHEIYDKCRQDFITAMSNYGKLPEYTEEKDVVEKMPLYWHFQKEVASLSGQASNPGMIIGIGVPLVVRVKDLNIDWFAKQLASGRFKGQ